MFAVTEVMCLVTQNASLVSLPSPVLSLLRHPDL